MRMAGGTARAVRLISTRRMFLREPSTEKLPGGSSAAARSSSLTLLRRMKTAGGLSRTERLTSTTQELLRTRMAGGVLLTARLTSTAIR